MSKIVFFCIPAHGHTNPTIGVVKELVKRGHDVYYYSFDEFKEKLEVVGANYISCDGYELDIEQSADKSADKVGKDMVFSTKLIVKAVLAMDEPVTKQISEMKPDVIVGDSVAYWGKLIAMKLGIPFVSSTTTFAFNRYSSSIMKTSFFDTIKMIAAIPKTKKLLEPLRKKGYPAETILDIVQNDNDTTTVVYTSKEFQPFADTFSDKYHFIGPSIREAYGGKIRIYDCYIPRSVRAAEISAEGKSIYLHDPGGKVAAAYTELTKCVLRDDNRRKERALENSL